MHGIGAAWHPVSGVYSSQRHDLANGPKYQHEYKPPGTTGLDPGTCCLGDLFVYSSKETTAYTTTSAAFSMGTVVFQGLMLRMIVILNESLPKLVC